MKLIELECPKCSGRLEKKNEKQLKGMHCGAIYKLAKFVDVEETTSAQSIRHKKKLGGFGKVVLSVVSFYLLILLLSILTMGCMFLKDWVADGVKQLFSEKKVQEPLPYETGEFQIIPGRNLSINIWNSEEMTPMEIKFADIVEKLYQKDYCDMTLEDWGRITSLVMKDGEDTIEVTAVLDGQERHIVCDRKAGEFSCGVSEVITFMWVFENLTILDVSRCEIEKNDLIGLQKLTELHCRNDMNELAQLMSHPEVVTMLVGVEISEETEAIERFKSLRVLECDVEDCNDISILGKFSQLEEIDLTVRNDKLKNFNILGELTNLKYISIYANGIYSIDFLENLTQLEVLEIKGGEYRSIEVLKELPNLKELTLQFHNVNDLSVLDSLTHLEKIEVD